ncbi:MAG: tRNA pseudouridine(55) synthase TruB, partial [Dehalococcoidia bacterium]
VGRPSRRERVGGVGRRPASGLDGILLVDKDANWTSHDVVARVRGITRQPRAGHTGTLDPLATGLLVVCLGKATRLVEYMVGHDKRYEGVIQLGVRTDTDDAAGQEVERRDVGEGWRERLDELAGRFSGEQEQTPPAYSAISVGGRRAYEIARQGGTPALRARRVTVHELRLAALAEDQVAIALHCGAGTYVRSLARDIGEALGCGAHLAQLRRTAAGPFKVEEAWTIDELVALAEHDLMEQAMLPPDEGVRELGAALVTEEHARALASGVRIMAAGGAGGAAGVARIYGRGGGFVGMGEVGAEGQIRAKKVISA